MILLACKHFGGTMQYVSEKWLKLVNTYYILFATVMLGTFVYLATTKQDFILRTENPVLGTGHIAIIAMSFFTAIYCLFFLRIFKKHNFWLAYSIGFVLYTLLLSITTEQAIGGQFEILFIALLITSNIFAPLYGITVGMAMIGLGIVFNTMELTGGTKYTILGPKFGTLYYILRSTITIILIVVLKKHYVTQLSDKSTFIEKYLVNSEVVKLLTNSLSDGVIILDQNGVIHSVNPTAEKLLGQVSDNILELDYKSVLKLKNNDGSAVEPDQEPVALALQTKTASNKELRLVTSDSETYIDMSVSSIANPETKNLYGAIIVLRDINKKKEEDSARSEFISTASHEMRTPVAAIEGFIELALNEKVSTIDANARKYLEKAKSSAQHLGRLFQDLLASAKAEDGRISSKPETIELGKLLEQQAEVSRMTAQQKGLGLEFIISTNDNTGKHKPAVLLKPLYYTYADPDRIREVATNLIDNAIKYTTTGKITIGLTGNDEVVQFFIQDTGVGIAEEDVNKLFHKFYRIDNSDTRTTGGTGLGLFICKKIIDLYHGRIWIESEKGKGTTFFVNLPRISTMQAETSKMKSSSEPINAGKSS